MTCQIRRSRNEHRGVHGRRANTFPLVPNSSQALRGWTWDWPRRSLSLKTVSGSDVASLRSALKAAPCEANHLSVKDRRGLRLAASESKHRHLPPQTTARPLEHHADVGQERKRAHALRRSFLALAALLPTPALATPCIAFIPPADQRGALEDMAGTSEAVPKDQDGVPYKTEWMQRGRIAHGNKPPVRFQAIIARGSSLLRQKTARPRRKWNCGR